MSERIDEQTILDLIKAEQYESAFNMLVEKYMRKLYWQVRKMVISHDDADDVLQNALIKVWNSLPKFRGDAKLSTWLYRIVANEALTFLSSRKNISLSDLTEDMEEAVTSTLESDPYFNGDEAQEKFQKALLTLPDKQRLVFNMKYFDDMKYEEMSEILGTSVGALKASYFHAVKKIEAYILEHD